jgi:hypothetical protein
MFRFVGFGVLRGIIRRVHEYPVCVTRSGLSHSTLSDLPTYRGGHTPHSSFGSIASNPSMRDFAAAAREDAPTLRSPVHAAADKQNRLSAYLRKTPVAEYRPPPDREPSFHLAPADVDVSLTIQIRESMRGLECLDSLCTRFVRCKEELIAIATQRLPLDTQSFSVSVVYK